MQVCSSLCPKSQTKLLQQNCSFFQPVKSICSTPKKIPWFPRQCSIVRIPGGQSRSHWNSHSWVSCSESADCDLVSRHIPPLFLTRSPTTSETYIIAFPDLIPFVCLRSVSLPSLKTCSHSTTCLDLVSRHICPPFLTNNSTLPAAHILFAISKYTEEVENWWGPTTFHTPPSFSQPSTLLGWNSILAIQIFTQGMLRCLDLGAKLIRQSVSKFTEPHRLSHLQHDLLPPNLTLWAAWSAGNLIDLNQTIIASLMQIVRRMRWILGLGIPRQKDLAPLGISWPSPPGQCGRSSHNMHRV